MLSHRAAGGFPKIEACTFTFEYVLDIPRRRLWKSPLCMSIGMRERIRSSRVRKISILDTRKCIVVECNSRQAINNAARRQPLIISHMMLIGTALLKRAQRMLHRLQRDSLDLVPTNSLLVCSNLQGGDIGDGELSKLNCLTRNANPAQLHGPRTIFLRPPQAWTIIFLQNSLRAV